MAGQHALFYPPPARPVHVDLAPAVYLDLGTGDGVHVQWTARRDPSLLVVGVDASADGLRDVARRLAAKPARGGLANAVLGVLPLEQAPGELADLADVLTVRCCHYRQAGFEVTATPIARVDVARLDTTWAGKLAFSGRDRRFLELRGHALATARDREPAA